MTPRLHALVLDVLYAAFNLMPLAAVTAAVLTLTMAPASGALLASGVLHAVAWLILTGLGGYAARRYLDLPAIYGLLGGTVLWVWLAPVTPDTRLTFFAYLLYGLESVMLHRFLRAPARVLRLALFISTAFAAAMIGVGAPAWMAIQMAVLMTSLVTLAAPAARPLRRGIERWERRWRRA